MQTFLTETRPNHPSPVQLTAASLGQLDSARLGKQRAEVKQVYTALETGKGWVHHPATKMWDGHLPALATYGFMCATEWKTRGFADTTIEWFADRATLTNEEGFRFNDTVWPWWYGHPEMVASHRNKLYWKNPAYYGKFYDWVPQPMRLPYIWPSPYVPDYFHVSAAEFKRQDWSVPSHWFVDKVTRQVSFNFDLLQGDYRV